MKRFLILPAILIVLFFSGCASLEPPVEVFYMGEGSLQYFFPELRWQSSDKDTWLHADWLYRTYPLEGEPEARTILNFTILSEVRTFRSIPASLVLRSGSEELVVPSERISLVYLDRGKTRYSSWLPSVMMEKFISGVEEGAEISVQFDDEQLIFRSGRRFPDHVSYFREVIADF